MKMAMSRKRLVELDERWDDIEQGIKKFKMILEGGPVPPFSAEEHIKLYTMIYNICTQKNDPVFWTQQLYEMYKECFDDYLNSVVIPSFGDKHEEFLLRELAKRWTNHQIMVRWLRHFFHYLDRFFVVRQALPTLKEVGQRCFLDLVYEKFKLKAADVIVTLINQEREGMVIDSALLKNAVSVYVAMGRGWMMNTMGEHVEMDYYECDFETAMLNDTAAYYSRKASDWIVEDSCPDYMLKVEECLKKEKDCVSHYLQANSEMKLLKIVRNQLLVVYAEQLLEKEHSGCLALLRDDKVEDLSRMCRLFREIPEGLERVANIFRQHVSSEGMVLIKQAEDAMSNKAEKKTGGSQELALVTKVIELHGKHLVYVTGCFSNNSLFHKALKEGFEAFFNKAVGGTSIAEILALYCDDILKKGGAEKLSDEAIEETLDKVVNLLAYVSDKDLFAEFHRKKLSRRLLFDRSTSDDHERLLLTKLKQQCGGQFTSKMEGMVTDLALAKDSLKHFQEYLSNNQTRLGMESTVTVITTGFWPSYKTSDLRLPAEMAKCVEVFKEFYKTKTKDRKLTWIYSLGTCNINGKFEQKTIELVVGTYQAAVLLLFSSADKLSYSDIKSQLNLGGDDLVRVLHSLSCAKYKILNKEPNTKSVSQNDHFEFNSKFTDRMKRIKIPLPPMDDRKKVVEEHVDKDRRYNIDSSIVRIMKSRKVLGFQQLVVECTEQLSSMFKPDMKQIKKRIEDLITREYLERDGTNPNSLRYLA